MNLAYIVEHLMTETTQVSNAEVAELLNAEVMVFFKTLEKLFLGMS